jgi:nitrous oxide reductase accessory protein NosL
LLKQAAGFVMNSKKIILVLAITLFIVSYAFAGDIKPIKPSSKDKCPVCGMFISKYTDWTAQIIFKDGSYAMFDGVKDMMKYYFNLKKYNPSKTISDMDSMYVTDYYSLAIIDGFKAYYVSGSDTLGPMGRELIPFAKEADAKGFLKDHKGKRILMFKDITPEIIKTLE